jgi:hypothetical protein
MSPEGQARLDRELAQLAQGGQRAELLVGTEEVVLYNDLPTSGARLGLPAVTDAIAPVPAGYPAMIDLAGLPAGSLLLAHLKGGSNCQRTIVAGGRHWTVVSYHPHGNGGGPPWDHTRHGFHTYLGELLAWLADVT